MSLSELEARIVECRRCPRLVAWREQVASEKRAAFRDETYWGRPVPGFGDPARGGVRAGAGPRRPRGQPHGAHLHRRPLGDWLFAAMHRTGFANQPTAVHRDDGLRLTGLWIGAAVRCAPPSNRPTPQERENCLPFAREELALLEPAVILCLGAFAWSAAMDLLPSRPRPRPRFGHGAELRPPDGDGPVLLGSFHPSQQNTFTGKLTEEMTDSVLLRARELARPALPDLETLVAGHLLAGVLFDLLALLLKVLGLLLALALKVLGLLRGVFALLHVLLDVLGLLAQLIARLLGVVLELLGVVADLLGVVARAAGRKSHTKDRRGGEGK